MTCITATLEDYWDDIIMPNLEDKVFVKLLEKESVRKRIINFLYDQEEEMVATLLGLETVRDYELSKEGM